MLHVLIGVGLLVLAVRQWRSRATEDETAKLPGWLVSIERVLTFVVVASSSVIAPVLGNVLFGQRATSSLVALRGWLDRHYAMTSVVVMLLIGAVIVGQGLKTLIS